MMRGASYARKYIADYLSVAIPPLLEEARIEFGLQDFQLPDPLDYNSYDPLQFNKFPSIGSLVSRTSNWRRTDINDYAEEEYEGVYAVRVFIWCRTPELPNGTWEEPSYDAALRVRDDLLGLVRSALLGSPSLNSDGICAINEGTLAEDYYDAFKSNDQSSRWIAGGNLSFDMRVNERTYKDKLGVSENMKIDASSNKGEMP